MGFFSNLFRGRDAPSNSTAGSGYGFFMGSTASGKRVNARSAMQMTAVYSCVRILSEAVAGLPLQFYRYNDNGGKEKAVDHPLYFLLHDGAESRDDFFCVPGDSDDALAFVGECVQSDHQERKG